MGEKVANPFGDPPERKKGRVGKRKRGVGARGERRPKTELLVRSHLAALMAMLPSVNRCKREWDRAKAFAGTITRDKKATTTERLMAHKTLVTMLMHEHKVAQYVDEQQQTAGIPITANSPDGEEGGTTLNGVAVMVNRIMIIRDTHPSLPPASPPPEIVATQGEEEHDGEEDGEGD